VSKAESLINLIEEYAKLAVGKYGDKLPYEVHTNPSVGEMNQMIRDASSNINRFLTTKSLREITIDPEVRFIADLEEGVVYTAPARLVVHGDLASEVGVSWDRTRDMPSWNSGKDAQFGPHVISGMVNLRSGTEVSSYYGMTYGNSCSIVYNKILIPYSSNLPDWLLDHLQTIQKKQRETK